MKTILITGGEGMFASDFKTEALGTAYNVVSYGRSQMDIRNAAQVDRVFQQVKPDIVVHTAAITNVDYCEDHEDDAYAVNAHGTQNVAKASESIEAKLVYISTCGLFGDDLKAYSEDDPVQLKTKYAKTKYEGERFAGDYCTRSFIVRPGWLFGGAKGHSKNFVYKRYLEALQNETLYSANDKFGCPTYTKHLTSKILELIATERYGTYHITNSGSASRYEYVREIIKTFGLTTEVQEVDSGSFVRKAPVPDCEILKNNNLILNGFELLPDWKSSISEYVSILMVE